jgi:hypothetical protein
MFVNSAEEIMKKTFGWLVMGVLAMGCGDDSGNNADNDAGNDTGNDTNADASDSAGDDIGAEIDAFNEEAAALARDACGAPEDVESLDEESEVRLCYSEIVRRFDDCSKGVLVNYPEETRAEIECLRDVMDTMIACCTEPSTDSLCTYQSAEQCGQDLASCPLDPDLEATLEAECS